MSRIRDLRQLLSHIEPDRVLWWAPEQGSICARDIDSWIENSGEVLERIRDRNVALYAGAESELAPLLVLLDGTCCQLTLLPSNASPDRLADIVVRSGSEILVTTDGQAVARGDFEVLPVPVVVGRSGDHPTTTSGDQDPASEWGGPETAPQQGRETAPQQGGAVGRPLHNKVPLHNNVGRPPHNGAVTRWVLPTSGTTGEPKLVAHTLASLTRTAKHDLRRGQAISLGIAVQSHGIRRTAGVPAELVRRVVPDPGASRSYSLTERVADLIAGGARRCRPRPPCGASC